MSNQMLYHLIKQYGQVRTFKANEIHHLNDTSSNLYAFEQGLAFLKQLDRKGKELISNIYIKGAIFIDMSDSSNSFNSKYYFYFKETTVVYQISIDALKETGDNTQITELIFQYTNNEMTKKELKLRDYLFNGKKGALLSNIIRLTNSFGVYQKDGNILIDIIITHEDLAQMCGMSRERVTKYISKLKAENTLKYDKSVKKFIVKDLSSIKSQISCENCPTNLCTIS